MKKNNQESKAILSFGFLIVALVVGFFILRSFSPDKEKTTLSSEQKVAENSATKSTTPTDNKPIDSHLEENQLRDSLADRGRTEDTTTSQSLTDASDISSLLSKARELVDQGNPQEAKAALESLLQQDPQNESALMELGMLHSIDFKDPAAAQGVFEKILQINPDNKIAVAELFSAYQEQGKEKEGIEYAQRLFEENPERANLASGIGEYLLSEDRPAEAVRYLEKAAETGKVSELMSLADAQSDLGQFDKAKENRRKVVEREVEVSKNDSSQIAKDRVTNAWLDLATECHKSGDEECLKESYSNLQNIDPTILAKVMDEANKERE